MLWLLRQILLLRGTILSKESPRQLALGLACGLMLGLVPKGNLLAFGLGMLIFGTRVSLATGMLSAVVFSMVAMFLDPLTHTIGHYVLTQPLLLPIWRAIYRLPFMAWTSLNNTVVMGSFLVSLAAFYPVYRCSLPWFERRRSCLRTDTTDAPTAMQLLSHDRDLPRTTPGFRERRSRRCA